MKKRLYYVLLSFALVICMLFTGVATVHAETFTENDTRDIDDSRMMAERTETQLPSGVYVARKKDTNIYIKTVINSATSSAARVRQKISSVVPNGANDTETLLKISYLAGSDEYIIRSMLDNQRVFYLDIATNNSPITWKRSESDSGLSSYFRWKITKSGDYYLISHKRSGTTYYLKSDSSSENAALTYTTNPNDSGVKWSFYSYSGSDLDEVVWDNVATTVFSGESFTYVSHMYNSGIGINGPITYSVYNTDGTVTDKANINSSTGVLQALGPGIVRIYANYSGSTCDWYVTLYIVDKGGAHLIENRQESLYMQVDDDDEPNYINNGGIAEIQKFDGGDYQRWVFTHVGSGYYKITSQISGYAVTVPTGSEGDEEVNLVLKPYVGSNNQKWTITLTSHGSYKIKSKSSESITDRDLAMVIETNNYSSGLNIQQRKYIDNDSYKDEWIIVPISTEVELEPQQQINWCWVASARMSSKKYMISPISQSSAAVFVKLGIKTSTPTSLQINEANEAATVEETEEALEYILSSDNVYSTWGKIYSETVLQTLLNNNCPVIIMRGWYTSYGVRNGGHFVVIYDYHWDSAHGYYVYDIFDPWNVNIGENYARSYQSICNGRTPAFSGDRVDTGVWEGIVVYKCGNYLNTINWPYA